LRKQAVNGGLHRLKFAERLKQTCLPVKLNIDSLNIYSGEYGVKPERQDNICHVRTSKPPHTVMLRNAEE